MSVHRDWLRARALSETQLRAWGARLDADQISLPVRTASGRTVFNLIRHFGSNTKYEISPAGSKRGFVLFGLGRQSKAIRRENVVILVEGFSDALSCHSAGLDNVVALLAIRPSRVQLALAHVFAKVVVLWSDGDTPGEAAARRFPGPAFIVQNHDPASFIASGGDAVALYDRIADLYRTYSFMCFAPDLRLLDAVLLQNAPDDPITI